MGHAAAQLFWPHPTEALGRGKKSQISLNFNYKVNFKDFLTKLCVSSHKWGVAKKVKYFEKKNTDSEMRFKLPSMQSLPCKEINRVICPVKKLT